MKKLSKDELKQMIDELEQKIFYLDMVDHWEPDDFRRYDDLTTELSILKEKLRKVENDDEDNL